MAKIICIKAPGFIGAIIRFFCRKKKPENGAEHAGS